MTFVKDDLTRSLIDGLSAVSPLAEPSDAAELACDELVELVAVEED